ncbi:unnamed protein product [Miscanthus lutarioriparius]|uniref:Large ribosomal subunit protein eL24-related N-terminal domain-containing protein n=1 Tax=Miscanthus lutarioriparius TaxID=422564 RepID=A0A811RA20_9POAL|nr:unnamed protein product [Miscanthus lutarioriparius]
MKRNPRKVKWTKAYRQLHVKDMTQDATFEFESYDRNLTEQTLKAIPLIIKTRHDRLEKHISNRHKPGKRKEIQKDSKEVAQNIGMLPKKLISNELAAEKTKIKWIHGLIISKFSVRLLVLALELANLNPETTLVFVVTPGILPTEAVPSFLDKHRTEA